MEMIPRFRKSVTTSADGSRSRALYPPPSPPQRFDAIVGIPHALSPCHLRDPLPVPNKSTAYSFLLIENIFPNEKQKYRRNPLCLKGLSELVETFYSIFWQKYLAYPV